MKVTFQIATLKKATIIKIACVIVTAVMVSACGSNKTRSVYLAPDKTTVTAAVTEEKNITPQPTASAPAEKKQDIVELEDTIVELEKCTRTEFLICSVFITSKLKDRNIFVYANFPNFESSQMHDDLRNTHKANEVQIADSIPARNQQMYSLSSDTPVRAKLIFKDTSPDATQVSLLHIKFTYGAGAGSGKALHNAKFNDIPISK